MIEQGEELWEHKPIADLVSEMNFGCLMRLLKRWCFTYSAARAPPCPAKEVVILFINGNGWVRVSHSINSASIWREENSILIGQRSTICSKMLFGFTKWSNQMKAHTHNKNIKKEQKLI